MITVKELATHLTRISERYQNTPIKVEGWNDTGDLMSFLLKGDIRLERDAHGNPVITIR